MPMSDAAIRRLKPREKQYKVSDFDGLFMLVRPNGVNRRAKLTPYRPPELPPLCGVEIMRGS